MKANWATFITGIYAIVAIVLVIWQSIGMNHVLELIPNQKNGIYLLGDEQEGGHSKATLQIENGFATLNCRTQPTNLFAYCGLIVPLTGVSAEQGLDLRRYSRLDLTMAFDSSVRDTVLLYLHNREDIGGRKFTRDNMHPINPLPGVATYSLDMDNFFIPSWWLLYFAHSQKDSHVDFSNVVALYMSTGDNREPKTTQLALGTVRFSGKWISAMDLYFYLLMGGLVIVLCRAAGYLINYRRELAHSKARAAELRSVNEFLSIERDRFESLSKTDNLTSCLNRAGASDILRRLAMEQSDGDAAPAALILFDIDRFKRLNDTYGHDAGDRVLVQLANFVRDHIRQQDVFARWGGEEFAIICPNTNAEQALLLAEKLRTGISAIKFDFPTVVTCSFGVATLQSSAIDDWFKRTDQALYQAKNAGRNCICMAESIEKH